VNIGEVKTKTLDESVREILAEMKGGEGDSDAMRRV
jgi:uncharacterized protein (UPF0335 family)